MAASSSLFPTTATALTIPMLVLVLLLVVGVFSTILFARYVRGPNTSEPLHEE